jgi:hypothetical protein
MTRTAKLYRLMHRITTWVRNIEITASVGQFVGWLFFTSGPVIIFILGLLTLLIP